MATRKLVIASDKYKGCLSSPEVCAKLAAGCREELPGSWEIETAPQADGGEGTVDALVTSLDGEYITSTVAGPRGRDVEASWGLIERAQKPTAAVIEMAAASGLALLEEADQDPFLTSTYGTGQLIREAAAAGAEEILLGIGGSATVDGGLGAALALGFEPLDGAGEPVERSGENLGEVRSIRASEVPAAVKQLEIKIACDVTNPLLGEEGAARVYGPQKGATEATVPELEANMENWANVIEEFAGEELREVPGAGAAGGLGFGLMGLLGAELTGGAELVAELTGLNSRLSDADVLITGEGAMDAQTAYGKTPQIVAERGRENGVELIIGVAGAQNEGYRELYPTFDFLVGLPRAPRTLEESMARASEALHDWGVDLARLLNKVL